MREIHGDREITPAMYVRAQKNRGNITNVIDGKYCIGCL